MGLKDGAGGGTGVREGALGGSIDNFLGKLFEASFLDRFPRKLLVIIFVEGYPLCDKFPRKLLVINFAEGYPLLM
jgi:hypothetical protein